jgi:predicted outer membrane repeat protein
MELAANIAEKGGGIYLHGSPSFDELTIHNNRATISGGGLYCWENSTPGFTDVTIRGNFAPTGGGVYCEQGSSLQFSEQNRNNLYFNCDAAGRGLGADIYSNNCNLMYVALDSFSVMTPTSYHASPVDSFTFDIWHAAGELLEGDAYVAVDGDDANPGTTPSSPFRTISHALSCVLPDNQIHLAPGVYSPSTNGEVFPIYWSDRISLAGSGVSETVLDAEQTGQLLVLHEISACHISNLTLTGGVAEQGGGIQCSNAVVSIVNCAITGNSAAGEWQSDGGGIYCEQSDITLENVIVNGNSSEGHGGGLYLYESSPLFSQSLITGNSAVDHGGGLYCAVSYPDLQQVTFSDNSASDGGGIYCIWESCPGLENCIMWGDQPQEISFYSMFGWNALTISCSNIEGGEESIETNGNGAVYWAEDNIDADPLFCDPDNGDYRLPLESPCRTDVCGFMGFTGETCEGEDVPNVGAAPRGCPDAVTLSQNYPNPFNPTTTIEFTLPYPQDIQLSVYNIMGQHIEVLARGCYSAGVHQVQFDGSKLTSGVYVCRLAVGEYVNTRKMLLIR